MMPAGRRDTVGNRNSRSLNFAHTGVMTMNRPWLAAAAMVIASTVALSAATIKEIKLADAYDEMNTLKTPVFDNAGRPGIVIELTAAYDRKAKIVRNTGRFMTKGPEYDLDKNLDLAVVLNEAFKKEAATMGLAPVTGAPWRVSGKLTQAYLESRQVYMGPMLFWGFLEADLLITSPTGQTTTRKMRAHSYSGQFNAGFGRQDEAQESLAELFLEGAQEMLALINRDFIKAPPAADMKSRLERVRSMGVEKAEADVWALGLSGFPEAGPALLGMLTTQPTEGLRARVINTLGVLGTREAIAVLGERYAKEDEDARFATLKAMDYIGGPDAERVINTSGAKDEDGGPNRLAMRILGKPAR
jgi:hypothetical protein